MKTLLTDRRAASALNQAILSGVYPRPWVFTTGSGRVVFPRSERDTQILGRRNVYLDPTVKLLRGATLLAQKGHISVDQDSVICRWAVLQSAGGNIAIGRRSFIGDNSSLIGRGDIHIGNDVLLASGVRIASSEHDIAPGEIPISRRPEWLAPVKVEDGAWLASNVVVTAGVTVGAGAVIGAGAVVTRDVPANSIAVGVPARIVGTRADRRKD